MRQLQATSDHELELDLSHNNISVIDFSQVEALAPFQQLDAISNNQYNSVVDLSGNLIDCDCRAYDLTRYFRDLIAPEVKTMIDISPDGLKCASSNISVADLHPKYLTCSLVQVLDNYTDCPLGCSCEWRKWDKSIIFNCENGNFTTVPSILIPKVLGELVSYNQTEVHLEGNLLTSGPSANDTGYKNVTKLFLSNNYIEQIAWVPPKTEVSMKIICFENVV